MLCFGSMIMCFQLEICKKFFFNFLLVMVERQTKWRLWGKEVDIIGKHFTSRLRTGKWIISYHSQHKMFSLKSDNNLSFPKCYAWNLCDQKYLLNSASPVDFRTFSFPDVGRTFCACGLRSLTCTSCEWFTDGFLSKIFGTFLTKDEKYYLSLCKVTCTWDEFEVLPGKNEINIRKLRKIKSSSLGGLWSSVAISDLDLIFQSSNLDLDLFPSLHLDLIYPNVHADLFFPYFLDFLLALLRVSLLITSEGT